MKKTMVGYYVPEVLADAMQATAGYLIGRGHEVPMIEKLDIAALESADVETEIVLINEGAECEKGALMVVEVPEEDVERARGMGERRSQGGGKFGRFVAEIEREMFNNSAFLDCLKERYPDAKAEAGDPLYDLMVREMHADLLDAAANHKPDVEYVDFEARGGKLDPVGLALAGRLHEIHDDLSEMNVEYLDGCECGLADSMVKGAFDDWRVSEMESFFGTDDLREQVLDELKEKFYEQGLTAVDLAYRGDVPVFVEPTVGRESAYVCFDGITSTPTNVVLDEGYFRALEASGTNIESYKEEMRKWFGEDDGEDFEMFCRQIDVAKPFFNLNDGSRDEVIGAKDLISIFHNSGYSGNFGFAVTLDLDALEKISQLAQMREAVRTGVLATDDPAVVGAQDTVFEVKAPSVHVHDFMNGAGHCEEASGILRFTASDILDGRLTLDNDAKRRYGVAATYGDWTGSDNVRCSQAPLPENFFSGLSIEECLGGKLDGAQIVPEFSVPVYEVIDTAGGQRTVVAREFVEAGGEMGDQRVSRLEVTEAALPRGEEIEQAVRARMERDGLLRCDERKSLRP